jgi:hypothetical protein
MAIVEAANATAFDPTLMTVAGLSRLGQPQFDAIMEWVESQRERERLRLEEHEERMADYRAAETQRLEAIEAARVERESRPATLADVRSVTAFP